MTEKEKMLAGEPFETMDRQLAEERRLASERLGRLNALSIDAEGYRKAVTELMPNAAADCLVRPPFHCDYGYNLYIGSEGFINFDCVILDGAPVRIGNHVLIGPAVQIYTFTHPMDYRERRQGIEQCKEIAIGDDCWIGGGAVICPGVILGQRVVVGAGSVVTKSFPDDVVVAGQPGAGDPPARLLSYRRRFRGNRRKRRSPAYCTARTASRDRTVRSIRAEADLRTPRGTPKNGRPAYSPPAAAAKNPAPAYF